MSPRSARALADDPPRSDRNTLNDLDYLNGILVGATDLVASTADQL